MNHEELARLEQAATPAPWVIVDRGGSYFGWDVEPTPSGMRGQFEHEADAALIAAARNALSALLAEVARLRAVAEASQELLIAEQARIGAASKRYTVEGERLFQAVAASWKEADQEWRAAVAALEETT